jgi:antitoxin (DNA-binding transcriptional repressor) of toxin-antitoxin stability system
MSLDWSIQNVSDWEALTENDTDISITEALVWHLLVVCMGSITESNWTEVYARIALIERLDGPSLSFPKYDLVDPSELVHNDYVLIDSTLYFVDEVTDRDLILSPYVRENMWMQAKRGEQVTLPNTGQPVAKHVGFEPRPIEPHDVHRRIGMGTNVSTESRTKWASGMIKRRLDKFVEQAERKMS